MRQHLPTRLSFTAEFLLISLIQTEHGSQRLKYLPQQIYIVRASVCAANAGWCFQPRLITRWHQILLTIELSHICLAICPSRYNVSRDIDSISCNTGKRGGAS